MTFVNVTAQSRNVTAIRRAVAGLVVVTGLQRVSSATRATAQEGPNLSAGNFLNITGIRNAAGVPLIAFVSGSVYKEGGIYMESNGAPHKLQKVVTGHPTQAASAACVDAISRASAPQFGPTWWSENMHDALYVCESVMLAQSHLCANASAEQL